jgi:hypothetical protein
MPNLRLIYDNAADRATTLAASTTAGALVASYMQNDRKSQAHRSTGTSVTYTLTWTNGESISGAGLPATNLTAAATAQLRLYSDTACTALVADSGVVYACPGLALGLWDWTQPLNANAFAYGGASKSAIWLPNPVFARGCKIDLVDAGNPAGYIDNARLVIGAWWAPTFNAKYGNQVTRQDRSTNARNDAGDNVADRADQFDRMSLDLQYMPETDRARLMQIFRNAGVARNIFLSLLPANASSVAEQDYMIYGKRANAAVAMDFYQAFSNKCDMEGW